MTDIRQALEEAWLTIHHEGYPPENERDTCRKCDRFRRFLDAEAWTDAAEMLVPENMIEWHAGKHFKGGGSAYMLDGKVLRDPIYVTAETPAHALLAACLKAKEQADG